MVRLTAAECTSSASRSNPLRLVNENAGVSIDMAIRLSKSFGSTPETWLGMQMVYDLWQARDRVNQITVRQFDVV